MEHHMDTHGTLHGYPWNITWTHGSMDGVVERSEAVSLGAQRRYVSSEMVCKRGQRRCLGEFRGGILVQRWCVTGQRRCLREVRGGMIIQRWCVRGQRRCLWEVRGDVVVQRWCVEALSLGGQRRCHCAPCRAPTPSPAYAQAVPSVSDGDGHRAQ